MQADVVRERLDVLCVQIAASSEFQIRLRSYHNDDGRAADGYCCITGGDVNGRCSGACRTFFRICLSHYATDIAPNQPCTFGLLVTEALGNDSIDFGRFAAADADDSSTLLPASRDVDNSTTKPFLNPVRMPISLTWPVSHVSCCSLFLDPETGHQRLRTMLLLLLLLLLLGFLLLSDFQSTNTLPFLNRS